MSQKATILTKEARIPQKTFDLKGLLKVLSVLNQEEKSEMFKLKLYVV